MSSIEELEQQVSELTATIAERDATISELESQLEISEAGRIALKASNDALTTENSSIKVLVEENDIAQSILSKAAVKLGEDIFDKQQSLLDIPDELSSSEKDAVRAARQADIVKLTEKQNEYKKYIRGEV